MTTLISAFILFVACDSKPKVIVAEDTTPHTTEPTGQAQDELHKVVVEDTLHTSRYTYLDVSENGNRFWIALPRKDVQKGTTVYYRGGLKKTNFKSVEHDRVFDYVYLVSDVSEDPATIGMPASHVHPSAGASNESTGPIAPPPGGLTLKQLFDNKQAQNGKTIRVKGRVVKVNNMIMNRNWIHIQDGSDSANPLDLTVTTTDKVSVGSVVAFEGTIALNKDFGAGYKYDIILEEAKLLP